MFSKEKLTIGIKDCKRTHSFIHTEQLAGNLHPDLESGMKARVKITNMTRSQPQSECLFSMLREEIRLLFYVEACYQGKVCPHSFLNKESDLYIVFLCNTHNAYRDISLFSSGLPQLCVQILVWPKPVTSRRIEQQVLKLEKVNKLTKFLKMI